MKGTLRLDQVRTEGIFSLDGEDFHVENNVWVIGNDESVVVVDAAHNARPIVEAVAGRRVLMIVATHGHNDHINAAVDLASAMHAPIALHPDDRMLWDAVFPSRSPDIALDGGERIDFAGAHLDVLHTPGHSPGGVCLYLAAEGLLFSGDTLFSGGPGATGRSFSSFPTIIESIKTKLLVLPAATVVHTGHGSDTTIGEEANGLEQWVKRGR